MSCKGGLLLQAFLRDNPNNFDSVVTTASHKLLCCACRRLRHIIINNTLTSSLLSCGNSVRWAVEESESVHILCVSPGLWAETHDSISNPVARRCGYMRWWWPIERKFGVGSSATLKANIDLCTLLPIAWNVTRFVQTCWWCATTE